MEDKVSGAQVVMKKKCKELEQELVDASRYRALVLEAARNPTFKTIFDSLEKIVNGPGADAE